MTKRVPIKRGGLMDAARRRVIARELVSIAPDAPWFLRAMAGMLDSPSGQPLGLERQPPQTPKESQP